MQGLRSFLASEIAAGRGFYPPGPLVFNALRLTPFDRVRIVILGQDPYHGRGQAMGLSFSVPAGVTPPPVAPQHLRRARDRSRPAGAGLRRPDAVGRARRAPAQQRAHRGSRLPRLPRRQGLGGIHRSRHRGALCASRGHRVPALGPVRAAEGGDRRHDAPSRADGCSPLPLLGEQRLLRLPPLLARERAARRGRAGAGRLAAARQSREARCRRTAAARSRRRSGRARRGTQHRASAVAQRSGRRRQRE